jgi:hypothetical protein
VEEVSRGEARRFVDLGRALPGRSYRLRVVETGRDLWQASVDGRVVGRPAFLPAGAASWRGVATAETWTAGRSHCNRYAYRCERVSVLRASGWAGLADAERVGAPVSGNAAGFSAGA